MVKLLAIAGVAALATACAVPPPVSGAANTIQGSRVTPAGSSKAADLGFHGPVYRNETHDGPN